MTDWFPSCMVPFALCLAVSVGGAGCETQPTHEVLTLTDISPRQVEPGDRVELTGSGFPLAADIRRITVRLSGTLSRPGMPACPRPVQFALSDPAMGDRVTDPVTGAERPATYAESAAHRITLDGSGALAFVAGEEMVRGLTACPGERFAPAPDAVPHATVSLTGLRGGITVLIETAQGTVLASSRALRGPVLDLHPPSEHRLAVELDARAQAERALQGMGFQLATVQAPEGGLKVDRVRPGSAADEAGIADGDTLERIDGATLLTVSDFRPAPGAVQCLLAVRRGDALDERVVRVEGLTRGVPVDMVATGVLLAVALSIVALLRAPPGGVVPWLARRLRSGTGPSLASVAPIAPAVPGLRGWVPILGDLTAVLPGHGDLRRWTTPRAALALAAVATTVAAAPLGPALVAVGGEVDMGLVHALAAAVLALGAVSAARRRPSRRPITAALRALGGVAAFQVPAAVALGGAVVAAGSLRLQGLVDAQGSEPWSWAAFRSPVALVLCCVYLVGAAVPVGGDTPASVATEDPRWRTAWRAARGAATFALCAVAAGAFLGAWRLPGVDRATQDATPALQMLGAAGFAARAWGLLFGVRALRGALGRMRADQAAALGWRYLLPAAGVGFCALTGAVALATRVPVAAGEVAAQVAGWTTFLVCVLAVGWALRQARGRADRGQGWAPDPFV